MRGQDGEAELERAFARMTEEGQKEPNPAPSCPASLQRWRLVAEDGSTSPLQAAKARPNEMPDSGRRPVSMPGQPPVQLFGSDDDEDASLRGCFVACPLSVEKGVAVGRGACRPSIAMPLPEPCLQAPLLGPRPPAGSAGFRPGYAAPALSSQASDYSAGIPRWTADAQLNEVVRAWSRLPKEIRTAIVSMVRST